MIESSPGSQGPRRVQLGLHSSGTCLVFQKTRYRDAENAHCLHGLLGPHQDQVRLPLSGSCFDSCLCYAFSFRGAGFAVSRAVSLRAKHALATVRPTVMSIQ